MRIFNDPPLMKGYIFWMVWYKALSINAWHRVCDIGIGEARYNSPLSVVRAFQCSSIPLWSFDLVYLRRISLAGHRGDKFPATFFVVGEEKSRDCRSHDRWGTNNRIYACIAAAAPFLSRTFRVHPLNHSEIITPVLRCITVVHSATRCRPIGQPLFILRSPTLGRSLRHYFE